MNRIIYLEGSRAVGKSTLLQNIRKEHPEFVVIDGSARKEYSFDNSIFDEYIINEKLYLACNIAQYEVLKTLDTTVVIVKGPYTDMFYAQRFGEIQFGEQFTSCNELSMYMEKSKNCIPDMIIYLDASREEILKRFSNDDKKRSSMKVFMDDWLIPFEQFYKKNEKTVVIDTNNKAPKQVYEEFMKILLK